MCKERLRGPGRHSGEFKKPQLEQKGKAAANISGFFRPTDTSFEAFLGAYRPVAPGEKVDADKTVNINGVCAIPCRIYGPMSTGIASDELWKRLQP